MRRFIQVSFVVFTAAVFTLSGEAQRRGGRGRGRGNVAAAPTVPPMSPRIAAEHGSIQWGWNHEQVEDYYRQRLTNEYLPQLRNKGQVEQDRLMQERDGIVATLRRSYLLLTGTVPQRRWDTSFVGSEYTHNNNESLLVYENLRSGDREFFFFFNDHLWKRFQARNVPRGSVLTFDMFVQSLDGLFEAPGLRRMRPDQADRIDSVLWQNENTELRVVDQSTFYGAYCLVYSDKSVQARLSELRRNMPAKTEVGARPGLQTEVVVGNVDNDNNSDVVDRMTGKIRRVQNTSAGTTATGTGANSTGTARPTGATPYTGASTTPPPNTGGNGSDPLAGLRGL